MLLASSIIISATSSRPSGLIKSYQAGVYGLIVVSGVLVLIGAGRVARRGLTAALGVGALGSIGLISQAQVVPRWYVGDILLLIAPVLLATACFVTFRFDAGLERRVFRVTFGSMLVAALIATLFPDPADGDRFAPPSLLLLTHTFVLFFACRGKIRIGAGLMVVGLVGLSWLSQWRGVVLAAAVVFLVFLFVVSGRRLRDTALSALLVAAALLIFAQLAPSGVVQDLQESRLVSTFTGGGLSQDSSTTFRFVEAAAVVSTIDREWTPLDFPFGMGHGSSYRIDQLSYLPGSNNFLERNGADGRIHNIHLGPMLILFRYGVFGALVTLLLVMYLISRLRAGAMSENARLASLSLAVLGCVVLFATSNVLTQPQFAATVSLFVGCWGARSTRSSRCPMAISGPAWTSCVVSASW